MKENNSDSLKRSHSKSSNFKLTMLSLLSSLTLSVAICALALISLNKELMMIISIASGVIFLISVVWFSSFKR